MEARKRPRPSRTHRDEAGDDASLSMSMDGQQSAAFGGGGGLKRNLFLGMAILFMSQIVIFSVLYMQWTPPAATPPSPKAQQGQEPHDAIHKYMDEAGCKISGKEPISALTR